MPVRALASTLAVVLLAGCGGSATEPRAVTTTTPDEARGPSDAQIRQAMGLPERVPVHAAGRAPAADVRVVKRWLDRLRAGDVAGAARLFAIPSRFQNISMVAVIHSRRDALRINASLPLRSAADQRAWRRRLRRLSRAAHRPARRRLRRGHGRAGPWGHPRTVGADRRVVSAARPRGRRSPGSGPAARGLGGLRQDYRWRHQVRPWPSEAKPIAR